MSKKILMIGKATHGKSTFGKMLAEHLNKAEIHSTSTYLVHRLALDLGESFESVLAKKGDLREKLAEIGNELCKVDPGVLVAIALLCARTDYVLIDGIRRESEYQATQKWFDHIFWVDRPDGDELKDHLELTPEHAHRVIINDGSLDDLNDKAKELALEITQA